MKKAFQALSLASLMLSIFPTMVSASGEEIQTNDVTSEMKSTLLHNGKSKIKDLLQSEGSGDLGVVANASTVQYANVFDYSDRDIAKSVKQTSDGGYVFVGETKALGNRDILFVKTDAALNLQWAYALGGTSIEDGAEVRQTSDGGYIIAGTSNASGTNDFYLIKTDATGAVQWSKTYGGTLYEQAEAMEIGPDGGYIVVGQKSEAYGNYDSYMLKVDSSGNVQWTKTLGQTGKDDGFHAVSVTPDGGYVAAGHQVVQESTSTSAGYGYIAKVTGTGATVFSTTLGRTAYFSGVTATSTGYYAVGNISVNSTTNPIDMFAAKVSTTGTTNWTRSFNYTKADDAADIKVAADGNLIITGMTTPGNVGAEDMLVGKMNTSGTMLWAQTLDFGGTGEHGRSVAVTNDGGYVLAGSYSNASEMYDALLVKLSMD
ncbi:hypothetical protein [Brevibacillus dissolubilis]|uniref:hypothetical protein n=1 Tax=Brevibacillus dissolubilis TaxID=1844116 RepID=UPI0011177FC1|nr:hypothetical protein [Brevibacillus dissolubilis]